MLLQVFDKMDIWAPEIDGYVSTRDRWTTWIDGCYDIRWPQYMPLHIAVVGCHVDSPGNMYGYTTYVRILSLIIKILCF